MYSLFVDYLKSGNAPLTHLTVVNDDDTTWEIEPSSGDLTQVFICNHEEADTRMIYHASLQGTTNVVLVANDTDMLFLGAYACALDKSRRWFLNYEWNTFADLAKFAAFFGDVTLYLPMFHSITGCDTTSYYHYRGKTDPWKRVVKSPSSLRMIEGLGKDEMPSELILNDCMEFVRRYVYCGKPQEDLVATKVRMYKNQAVKRSSSLPPDPNSLRHDILRKHHQAYTWRRCIERIIVPLPIQKYDWKRVNGVIVP